MTTTATVSNTTLFAVAAQFLGDATQWVRIAQVNGLADSSIAGTVTLVLPAPDPAATGGIISIGALAALPATPVMVVTGPAGAVAANGANAGAGAATWNGFNWDDGSVWG